MTLPAAAVMAALAELVLHYFPWQMVIHRKLPRPMAYILGVLGFTLPITWLWWGQWSLVCDLWIVIIVAGLAVIMAYVVDYLIHALRRGHEAQEMLDEKRKTEQ